MRTRLVRLKVRVRVMAMVMARVRVRVRVRVKVRVKVRVRVSNAPLPPFGSEIPQRTHRRPSVYTMCSVGSSVVMTD